MVRKTKWDSWESGPLGVTEQEISKETDALTSLRFCSILSCADVPARLSAALRRSSSNLAFFSSSVRGAISSVDSAKSVCSVLVAWNSACAWLRNFFPQLLQIRLRATSPALLWQNWGQLLECRMFVEWGAGVVNQRVLHRRRESSEKTYRAAGSTSGLVSSSST